MNVAEGGRFRYLRGNGKDKAADPTRTPIGVFKRPTPEQLIIGLRILQQKGEIHIADKITTRLKEVLPHRRGRL